MSYSIQVVTLPVGDVDRAVEFYTQQAGFNLDVDYAPNPSFRVVQLTPPGSACSIQFGEGLTDATPGSVRATYLVVKDLDAGRRELLDRGVSVSPLRHKAQRATWQGRWEEGPDPQHASHATFADFTDPDGNTWTLQEVPAADDAG